MPTRSPTGRLERTLAFEADVLDSGIQLRYLLWRAESDYFMRFYERETFVRPANVAMAINADEIAMAHSINATPGVPLISATPIAPRNSAAPKPTKLAMCPNLIAAMMLAIGATKGSAHSSTNDGFDSGPSHQVGLPILRLVTATAMIAKKTRSHETIVTVRHVLVSTERLLVDAVTACTIQALWEWSDLKTDARS